MHKLLSKYAGQYVAFIGEEIVASGKTTLQAYTKAKGTHPKQMITLEYIPTKKETLTFL